MVLHSTGWFAGVINNEGILIGMEIAARTGSGRVTVSGDHSDQLKQDMELCRYSLAYNFPWLEEPLMQFDWHANLCGKVYNVKGASGRMALLYGMLGILNEPLPFRPEDVLISADVTIRGVVLPVDYFDEKYALVRQRNLKLMIVSNMQEAPSHLQVWRISHIRELLCRRKSSIPKEMRVEELR